MRNGLVLCGVVVLCLCGREVAQETDVSRNNCKSPGVLRFDDFAQKTKDNYEALPASDPALASKLAASSIEPGWSSAIWRTALLDNLTFKADTTYSKLLQRGPLLDGLETPF